MWPWHTTQQESIDLLIYNLFEPNIFPKHTNCWWCVSIVRATSQLHRLWLFPCHLRKTGETNIHRENHLFGDSLKTEIQQVWVKSSNHFTNPSTKSTLKKHHQQWPLEWRWCHWVRSSQIWKVSGIDGETFATWGTSKKRGATLMFGKKTSRFSVLKAQALLESHIHFWCRRPGSRNLKHRKFGCKKSSHHLFSAKKHWSLGSCSRKETNQGKHLLHVFIKITKLFSTQLFSEYFLFLFSHKIPFEKRTAWCYITFQPFWPHKKLGSQHTFAQIFRQKTGFLKAKTGNRGKSFPVSAAWLR